MNKTLVFFLALLLVGLGAGLVYVGWRLSRPAIETPRVTLVPAVDKPPPPLWKKDKQPGWLSDFTLTERSGKTFQAESLAGKVWAASFFFADCPGECHRQNQSIALFADEFGPEGVTFVSITCDPERDTPERLTQYAANYTRSKDQWLFLTGDMKYIRRVGAEFFGVAVDKGTHGSRLILVDKWGNIRGYFSTNGAKHPDEFAAIRPTLQQLLAETEPPTELTPQASASGDFAHEDNAEKSTDKVTPQPAPDSPREVTAPPNTKPQ